MGKVFQFHPVVEQSALFPIIQSQGFCHGNCAAIETSCGSFGCTDPTAATTTPTRFKTMGLAESSTSAVSVRVEVQAAQATDPAACNFFPDALYDDGSCSYPPPGYPAIAPRIWLKT